MINIKKYDSNGNCRHFKVNNQFLNQLCKLRTVKDITSKYRIYVNIDTIVKGSYNLLGNSNYEYDSNEFITRNNYGYQFKAYDIRNNYKDYFLCNYDTDILEDIEPGTNNRVDSVIVYDLFNKRVEYDGDIMDYISVEDEIKPGNITVAIDTITDIEVSTFDYSLKDIQVKEQLIYTIKNITIEYIKKEF